MIPVWTERQASEPEVGFSGIGVELAAAWIGSRGTALLYLVDAGGEVCTPCPGPSLPIAGTTNRDRKSAATE